MGEPRQDRQSRFFTWLSGAVSPSRLSELYQAFADLKDVLSAPGYLHRLKGSLMETTDADEIDRLYDDLCADARFMRSHQSGVELSLLKHYARYCRESRAEAAGEPHKEAIPSGDALVERLKRDGIAYADHRPKKGALWIAQTLKTDALIRDFKARGMQFTYLEAKKQWWTWDASPAGPKEAGTGTDRDKTRDESAPVAAGGGVSAEAAARRSAPTKTGQDGRAALTGEEGLRQWLKEKRPEANADSVVAALRVAEGFARRAHMRSDRLMGLAPSALKACVGQLAASKAFADSDPQGFRDFRSAAPLLMEYAGSLSAAEKTEPAAPSQTETPASPKVQAEEGAEMEASLAELLRGEQFADLLKALVDKGVRKLEDFKRLDLRSFMDQNGLYGTDQRQAVYSALRRALASESGAEAAAGWKLVTPEREYSASSPAGALLEYCRAVAARYPQGFRGLIGRRMTGADATPLAATRQRASDLRLEDPEAYLDGEIDSNTALIYARWIGGACRGNDPSRAAAGTAPARTGGPKAGEGAGPAKDPGPVPEKPSEEPVVQEIPPEPVPLQKKVERLVLEAGLEGVTLDQLYERIPGATIVALRQIRDNSVKLVNIADRLIHLDAFVDWDDGARKLEEILEKLLENNDGYVSSSQLYESVGAEMQAFLDRNGLNNPRKVFDVVEHLFKKSGYHGKRYTFWRKAHISRTQ